MVGVCGEATGVVAVAGGTTVAAKLGSIPMPDKGAGVEGVNTAGDPTTVLVLTFSGLV